ncbi:MAG TPA: ferritin-like domain-containing protein [Balneolaceae bacterium]
MNFLDLLDEISTEGLDKESKDQFLDRKQALSKIGSFGKNLSLAALPLGFLATMTKPAKAQSSQNVIDVLNFALTAEYLEAEYYQTGLDSGVVQSNYQSLFEQINMHEQSHVAFLQETITSLGGTPVEKPTFDYTAGGMFTPFEDPAQFLALSQAFEDTGVRAYKGQAGNLINSDAVLTAALRIHSVEARHASQVRRVRGLEGWIPFDNRGEGMPEATQPVYEGEANTVHCHCDVTTITDVSEEAVTESFDEPLTREEVLAILSLFIAN